MRTRPATTLNSPHRRYASRHFTRERLTRLRLPRVLTDIAGSLVSPPSHDWSPTVANGSGVCSFKSHPLAGNLLCDVPGLRAKSSEWRAEYRYRAKISSRAFTLRSVPLSPLTHRTIEHDLGPSWYPQIIASRDRPEEGFQTPLGLYPPGTLPDLADLVCRKRPADPAPIESSGDLGDAKGCVGKDDETFVSPALFPGARADVQRSPVSWVIHRPLTALLLLPRVAVL